MNRVTHFEIQADNLERAKKFYQTVFGWKVEQWMSKEKDGMDYWGFITGKSMPGINGGLYDRSTSENKFYLFDCTIDVANIDKAVEAVKANGGTIIKEKSEIAGVGWFASAKDTEDNRFGLMQAIEMPK